MSRDIGNEIIAAIAAVGVIIFGFVFSIILSVSDTNNTSLSENVSIHSSTSITEDIHPARVAPSLVITTKAIHTQLTISSTEETTKLLKGCEPPHDWPIYVVQDDDSLFSIAISVDSTAEELRNVNCLESNEGIIPGQVLAVPYFP